MSKIIEPLDFFLLRTPRLSFDSVRSLNDCSNEEEWRTGLYRWYQDKDIQDAIYLASPSLYEKMTAWLSKGNEFSIERKVLMSLYKYAVRMGTRPTPFGLFAGVSLGEITADTTKIILARRYVSQKRLDSGLHQRVFSNVTPNEAFRRNLFLFRNTSIYKFQEGYRYYEFTSADGKPKYILNYIENSEFLELVLTKVAYGLGYSELVNSLTEIHVPEFLARNFIDELYISQVLVSGQSFVISGTSVSPLDLKETTPARLQSIIQARDNINNLLPSGFKYEPNNTIFHVDLKVEVEKNQLSERVVGMISSELSELLKISVKRIPPELKKFKELFLKRYENRQVPLLEALDPDIGIGYGSTYLGFRMASPLIDGLDFQSTGRTEVPSALLTNLILEKLMEAKESGKREVEIHNHDLIKLNKNLDNSESLPPTFYAIGNLIADDCLETDEGKFLFNLSACSGPSALPLLARFGHLDPALKAKMDGCASLELRDDLIVAGIVHLPDPSAGNIVSRPAIRTHDISFLGHSDLPTNHQIYAADLMISIYDDQLILFSQSLGRRIIPRLDCAHNFRSGMNVYRFLCDVQYEENSFSLGWDWDILQEQDFLPRVSFKHIVLSRARWLIKKPMSKKWGKDASELLKREFIEYYNLPQQVMLTEGDNELFIDLNCLFGIQLILDKLNNTDVVLTEVLQGSLVTDVASQSYFNEVILPFRSVQDNRKRIKIKELPQLLNRTFSLGSDWMYLKVYCGIMSSDRILIKYILPAMEMLRTDNLIRKWYFVRYDEDGYHLRLRILLNKAFSEVGTSIISTLNELFNPLIKEGIVQKTQYDTYVRELERYGVYTMELSESVFHADSIFVTKLLSGLCDENKASRWLWGIYGVDQLLTCFELDLDEKLTFCASLRTSFRQEFKGDNLDFQLDQRFRKYRQEIELVLDSTSTIVDCASIHSQDWRTEIARVFKQVCSTVKDQNSPFSLYDLLSSYCHMFLNRLFYTDQRLHELTIYHCLRKHYKGVAHKRSSKMGMLS